jgi:hypothetical protein
MPAKSKRPEKPVVSDWSETKIWFTIELPTSRGADTFFQWGSEFRDKALADYVLSNCTDYPAGIVREGVVVEHSERVRRHRALYEKGKAPTPKQSTSSSQ